LLQAKENYVVARANENQTNAALEAQKADAYKLRDDLIEYTLRQREFESNRTLYEGLLQRLRTAGVEAGLESMEIDVVDQALPPAKPMLRSQTKIILVAAIFGLIGGIIVAFLIDSLDTGLRTIAEIESVTELPSLAVIPRARRTSAEQSAAMTPAEKNLIVLAQSKSQFAESFRALRTSLLLSTAGRPPKYILLTSATPSEGKTTLSTNLACILAQGDARVLLIDTDLRRSSVHHRFGMSNKVGLTSVLTGAVPLSQAAQNVPEVPNLDVLPSGPMPPFPTEMLSSEAMDSLLKQCGDIYTHVLMDTPPVLSVTDGVVLARHADAVLLIVRHGKSSKHVVRRARDLLVRSGAPLTGIVLNAVDLNSPDYYGYYGYSGYSYSSPDSGSWEPHTAPEGNSRRSEETK
jgi:succinoglycan biosynthesis transport protein ExoP